MTTAVFLTLRAPVGPHRPSRKKASIDQLPEKKRQVLSPDVQRPSQGKQREKGIHWCSLMLKAVVLGILLFTQNGASGSVFLFAETVPVGLCFSSLKWCQWVCVSRY